ncbi:hypothetical protein HAP41_0000026100 [Bradyrhizobium barranii subsp. apii]|uniref:Uncharacterized protein n=1 Tax=Bradyrhizobium barranii subsp. apii TaxID=2819348 RepID=A0A8T5VFY3_9BRAD|nr:hypothetical protein [Bradyrhizobium barranii]UPT83877.1 hypothetical protein HAP41_0000026100 [Bradyrhizobium barranii subsp. apii]
MALLSFVESAPRAYRLKVGNADLFRNSTEPGTSPGMGLHVIKGKEILDRIANSRTHAVYSHTAIAVPDLEHAQMLKYLTAPVERRIAA